MPYLTLVVGDTLIGDVKSRLINVPSITVCDSAKEIILNHLGVKKIIVNVETNNILASLLLLMRI